MQPIPSVLIAPTIKRNGPSIFEDSTIIREFLASNRLEVATGFCMQTDGILNNVNDVLVFKLTFDLLTIALYTQSENVGLQQMYEFIAGIPFYCAHPRSLILC